MGGLRSGTGGVTFDSVVGTNTLTLGTGGISDSAGPVTFNSNVALTASQTWALATNQAATFNGTFAGGAAATTLTIADGLASTAQQAVHDAGDG